MSYDKDTIKFVPTPRYPAFMDLTNCVFTRLTVLGYAGTLQPKQGYWFCECSCGEIVVIRGQSLRTGNTKSCGCLKRDKWQKVIKTHGMSTTPEYAAYYAAYNRCTNPKSEKFPQYGGRGIEFRFTSFEEFFEHLGKRPSGDHSLDRIDVNGHYEKGNVKWSTLLEQSHNKQHSHLITFQGRTMVLTAWARVLGVPYSRLKGRLRRLGWDVERAFTEPPHQVRSSS